MKGVRDGFPRALPTLATLAAAMTAAPLQECTARYCANRSKVAARASECSEPQRDVSGPSCTLRILRASRRSFLFTGARCGCHQATFLEQDRLFVPSTRPALSARLVLELASNASAVPSAGG